MLRLAIKLGILLAPFVIFFTWAEITLTALPNTFSKKVTLLERTSTNIEVLVLGNSQEVDGIDPSRFHYHGFNMASDAQSLYEDTRILLRWGSSLSRLKLVMFPADYVSLEYPPEGGAHGARQVFYNRYYHILPPLSRLRPELYYFSLVATYGIRPSIYSLLRGQPPEDVSASSTTDTGFVRIAGCLSTNDVETDRTAAVMVQAHEAQMEKKYITSNVAYLREALTWCKSKNVKVVFITTPVYKSYSDHIDMKRFTLMQESIQNLCLEYGADYFNFRSDNRFAHARTDFRNSNHLNPQGARIFSEIVDQEVLDSLLKR
jgi:DltD protein